MYFWSRCCEFWSPLYAEHPSGLWVARASSTLLFLTSSSNHLIGKDHTSLLSLSLAISQFSFTTASPHQMEIPPIFALSSPYSTSQNVLVLPLLSTLAHLPQNVHPQPPPRPSPPRTNPPRRRPRHNPHLPSQHPLHRPNAPLVLAPPPRLPLHPPRLPTLLCPRWRGRAAQRQLPVLV